MDILILPVSGGHFPIQMGILCDLCDIKYRPEVVMSTSGGNLTAYTGLAANWQSNQIYRVTSGLSSSLMLNKWSNIIPTWSVGYYKGSMYDFTDNKLVDYMENFFTEENISSTEIWSGTANCEVGKASIFCNLCKNESILKPHVDSKLYATLPPVYLNHDIKKITDVAIASAALPILMPSKIIDGHSHSDGGHYYSSPLTPLQDSIPDKYRMIMISSYNIEGTCKTIGKEKCTMLDKTLDTFSRIVEGLCVQDRLCAIKLVGKKINRREGEIQRMEDLASLIEEQKLYKRSFIELYPNTKKKIDITNFNYRHVHEIIEQQHCNYNYRFWTSGDMLM